MTKPITTAARAIQCKMGKGKAGMMKPYPRPRLGSIPVRFQTVPVPNMRNAMV